MQDKAALEVRVKDMQALLEAAQSQRGEHRQAFKVRLRVPGPKLQQPAEVNTAQQPQATQLPCWQLHHSAVTQAFPLLQEERAAREAAEARQAEAAACHQQELQRVREDTQRQQQARADAQEAAQAQLAAVQSELQVRVLAVPWCQLNRS